MTSTRALWFLLSLLAADIRAAPQCAGSLCIPWQKRQGSNDIVLTETLVEVFSDTQTTTLTETFTSASSSGYVTSSTSVSEDHHDGSSSPAATVTPGVDLVGDVSDPDTTAQGVLFLPLDSDVSSAAAVLPTISIGDSPATVASTDSASAAAPPTPIPTSLLSNDYPSLPISPLATSTSSSASSNDTFASSAAGPAFAAQTPVVKGPLVSAYYPDWVSDSLPPESIDMTRFDWIDFAFALPDQNFNLGWDDPSVPGILSRLVTAAHSKGTKVKLSIGGWTGSR